VSTASVITPSSPCVLCGGTVGTGSDGAHELCKARARRGAATPSLGKRCEACAGRGHTSRVPMNHGIWDPTPAQLARCFPKCTACDGKGHA